jgi:magnesium transporter
MIRTLLRDDAGTITTDIEIKQLAEALKNRANLIWVDMIEPATANVEHILGDMFGFHPLAIDDALHETHVPKVDDWHDYLYIVLRGASLTNGDSQQLEVPELDLFVGANFIVTYSEEPIAALDRVWKSCQLDERRLNRGTDYLLYQLADELVNDAIEAVEQMHSDLDQIEEQIFGEAPADVSEDLFGLKRNILKLRRITVPQRDVLNKLSRNEYQVIDAADRVFFRDVYDHLIQLNDLLADMLILVGSALDTYLSVVNNRMNDIMKTLTIITAFFMPLTFITGFFGMNFFHAIAPLDAWSGSSAFLFSLALMVFIPVIMYFWMRRRSWL